jgi:hypothetical protein
VYPRKSAQNIVLPQDGALSTTQIKRGAVQYCIIPFACVKAFENNHRAYGNDRSAENCALIVPDGVDEAG